MFPFRWTTNSPPGVKAREDDSFSDRISSMVGNLRLALARRAIRRSTTRWHRLRERCASARKADTLKAIVMVKPAAKTAALCWPSALWAPVRRFYDWFSNLRMGMEDGFHKGFYQLTQGFIKNEEHIVFPDHGGRRLD